MLKPITIYHLTSSIPEQKVCTIGVGWWLALNSHPGRWYVEAIHLDDNGKPKTIELKAASYESLDAAPITGRLMFDVGEFVEQYGVVKHKEPQDVDDVWEENKLGPHTDDIDDADEVGAAEIRQPFKRQDRRMEFASNILILRNGGDNSGYWVATGVSFSELNEPKLIIKKVAHSDGSLVDCEVRQTTFISHVAPASGEDIATIMMAKEEMVKRYDDILARVGGGW